jgi:LacI family transcriptional regulator
MRNQTLHRRATIKEVASSAGVAAITASYVLSGRGDEKRISSGTQKRVQDAARELGYQKNGLAVALLEGRIHTVGLVLQVGPDEQESQSLHLYGKDMLAAVTWAGAQAGLRLTTVLARGNNTVSVSELVDGRVDGLILASIRDEALARAVYETGFPTITVGSGYSERRVTVDNVDGMRQATQHLIDLGHQRIVYVNLTSFEDFVAPIGTSQERQAGYREAMQTAGYAPHICSIGETRTLLRLPSGERPTGFVCFSDTLASTLRKYIQQEQLRVPEDISLVGFDDNILARNMMPLLTTVHNPIDAQVKTAIEQLQALWRGENPPLPAPFPARLMVRNSTAAAPKE